LDTADNPVDNVQFAKFYFLILGAGVYLHSDKAYVGIINTQFLESKLISNDNEVAILRKNKLLSFDSRLYTDNNKRY
jgi:hypothetical protein